MTRRDLGVLFSALVGAYFIITAVTRLGLWMTVNPLHRAEAGALGLLFIAVLIALVAGGAALFAYRRAVGSWLFADSPGSQAPAPERETELARDLASLGVAYLAIRSILWGIEEMPTIILWWSRRSVLDPWRPRALAALLASLCLLGIPFVIGFLLFRGRTWIIGRLTGTAGSSCVALQPEARLSAVAFSLAGIFLILEQIPGIAYHFLRPPSSTETYSSRPIFISRVITLTMGVALVVAARYLGRSDAATLWARLRGRDAGESPGTDRADHATLTDAEP